jgi:hypothetical protein
LDFVPSFVSKLLTELDEPLFDLLDDSESSLEPEVVYEVDSVDSELELFLELFDLELLEVSYEFPDTSESELSTPEESTNPSGTLFTKYNKSTNTNEIANTTTMFGFTR